MYKLTLRLAFLDLLGLKSTDNIHLNMTGLGKDWQVTFSIIAQSFQLVLSSKFSGGRNVRLILSVIALLCCKDSSFGVTLFFWKWCKWFFEIKMLVVEYYFKLVLDLIFLFVTIFKNNYNQKHLCLNSKTKSSVILN